MKAYRQVFSILVFFLVLVMGIFFVNVADVFCADQFHIVVNGDTLGSIAGRHGTTWQELWKKNSGILNPDLIYPGQKILFTEVPARKSISKKNFTHRLITFMFKTAGLPYASQNELEENLLQHRRRLGELGFEKMYAQRELITLYQRDTRRYEIHQLAKAIMEISNNDYDLAIKLTALGWQESHFVNRRGARGEVSCFQLLPSTIQFLFDLDKKQLQDVLELIENSPQHAIFCVMYFMSRHKTWDMAIKAYNTNPSYSTIYHHKIARVKTVLLQ